MASTKRHAVIDGQIQEAMDHEGDYEMLDPNTIFGEHINSIPLANAVQGARLFYGAKFVSQALPLVNREAPLVQSLMMGRNDNRSFDEHLGEFAGARRSKHEGEVSEITPDGIKLKLPDGKEHFVELYDTLPFNRKSSIKNLSKVEVGQKVKPGDLLATSNFTDDKGTLAMGMNARIGLTPFKGWSMDDALAMSESFAKRLKSEMHMMMSQDFDDNTKGGHDHFVSLFPAAFTKDQLKHMDRDGVVKPGTVLNSGDPVILATEPKLVTAADANVGKISRAMQQMRKNSTQTWDYQDPGTVTDVKKLKNGVRLIVRSESPTKVGDKAVLRSGQKGILSKIIPDDQMLKTKDGKPMDVLLNSLGVPSRVNNNLVYEMMLGKLADKQGSPIKVPAFNHPDEKWFDTVKQQLSDAGLSDTEEVYDPTTNKMLEQPVLVGNAFLQKLIHVGESKVSARGTGSYDANEAPSRGGADSAKAKRMSGLESNALMSSGAYAVLREGSTIRGQKNDDFWKQLRLGHKPQMPKEPFVWHKFHALLNGAGFHAKKLGKGRMRLGPMTDEILEANSPKIVRNGEIVDLGDLSPVSGGLFDPALTAGNSWGKIPLPEPLPLPSFESSIQTLLGLSKKDFEEILAGRKSLDEERKK